jgi:hypothetical protein
MKTTLNKIRETAPCADGWRKLLTYLGKIQADDEPLSLLTILDSNGLDDTLYCLKAVEGYDREKHLFSVWCAWEVRGLMSPDLIAVIEVAERYARLVATTKELLAAQSAVRATVRAAAKVAVQDAVQYAAWAAARAAAKAVARDAAWAAARDAAWAAAWAAAKDATWGAARDAAWDAEWDATRAKQADELRRVLECIDANVDAYPYNITGEKK